MNAVKTIETEVEPVQPPVPAWLHPDDDGMLPPALQAFYDKLPPTVTKICEGARRTMRNAYVEGLCTVRDALAESELFFTDWCKAAGINVRTAQTIVARADRAKR